MKSERLIKAYTTGRYKVELLESKNGYVIRYLTFKYGNLTTSEVVNDYKIADYMFETKIDDLEGQ